MNNVNFIFLVNNFNHSVYQGVERRAPANHEYQKYVKNIEGAFDTGRIENVVPLEYQGGVWQEVADEPASRQLALNQIPIDDADIGYGQDGAYVSNRELKAVFVDKLY